MNIFILAIFILILVITLILSYLRVKYTQYYIFLFLGLGIGSLMYNLDLEIFYFGLRLESWSWLIIMLFLLIGLSSNKKINQSLKLLKNTNFKYYFLYVLLLFFGLLRTDYLAEGVGLSLTMLFSLLAICHFYSNKYKYSEFEKLIYFSIAINLVTLIIFIFIGKPLIQYDYTGTPRLTGSMGWASLAYFLMVPFNLILVKCVERPKKQYLLILIIISLLIIGTISRIGLMMLSLSILSVFSVLKSGKTKIILLSIIVLICIFPLFYELFYTRLFYSSTSLIATSGRLTAILFLFDYYLTDVISFILGQGTGVARASIENLSELGISRVHSALGEAFFDVGVFGALFLFLFVFKSFINSWLYLKKLKITINFKQRNDKYCIRYLLLGMLGSITLFPLILFENMYNLYLTSVLFIFVLYGELQSNRFK